jgi:hypothetical protein
MKLYQLDLSKRGIDALSMTERPTPNAGPGQVLIRLRAFSLNFRDLLIANGLYQVSVKSDRLIPVSDGAGEVIETGAGVTRFAKGDRVLASYFQGWVDGPLTYPAMGTSLGGGIDGVLAEYVALPEQGVVKIPAGLSFEEAATLPCAGVTAWHALVETGRLESGQSVLVLGTGGVSMIGLQIAKGKGARVIVTSSSDESWLAPAPQVPTAWSTTRPRRTGIRKYSSSPAAPEWTTFSKWAAPARCQVVTSSGHPRPGQHHPVCSPACRTTSTSYRSAGQDPRIQGILVGSRGMLEPDRCFSRQPTKPVI